MRECRWRLGMFDWDGTLWNSIDLAYRRPLDVCRQCGIKPLPFEVWRDVPTSDFIKVGSIKGLPKGATPEKIWKMGKKYFNARWKTVPFYPGAGKLIRLCMKLAISRAIVSGQDQGIIVKALRKSDFNNSGWINNIRGEVRDKENVLVETLDYWGEKAEDAFYLDDTHEGLVAARRLGITAIGITHGLNSERLIRKARPDFVVNSLYDVIKILENGRR
ncbi:MAG: HAD hydrolase-like protein [bacterium]|nr:HAD hydrolase-like protein [bacterium]